MIEIKKWNLTAVITCHIKTNALQNVIYHTQH